MSFTDPFGDELESGRLWLRNYNTTDKMISKLLPSMWANPTKGQRSLTPKSHKQWKARKNQRKARRRNHK